MNIYKIYFHIYTYLKTYCSTLDFRPCKISKYSQSYDLPSPPPAQMLHVLCRPVWSTCRRTRGYAQWVLGSFSPLQ